MRATKIAAAALMAVTLVAGPALAGGGGGGSSSSNSENTSRRRVTASEHYLDLAGLTATVTENFRARGVLHVDAGLDIPDDDLRERAEYFMPRVRASCVEALIQYSGRQYRRGDVPDAERIARLLQTAVDDALGREGAQVVLTMVMVHSGR